jgi:hypothetical protein
MATPTTDPWAASLESLGQQQQPTTNPMDAGLANTQQQPTVADTIRSFAQQQPDPLTQSLQQEPPQPPPIWEKPMQAGGVVFCVALVLGFSVLVVRRAPRWMLRIFACLAVAWAGLTASVLAYTAMRSVDYVHGSSLYSGNEPVVVIEPSLWPMIIASGGLVLVVGALAFLIIETIAGIRDKSNRQSSK